MQRTKEQWLKTFRSYAETIVKPLIANAQHMSRDEKAGKINKQLNLSREDKIVAIKGIAASEGWSNERLLDEILRITYASYLVMLEYRNKVWPCQLPRP